MIQLLLIVFSTFANAGNELGNGGDLVAQEFTAAGRQLVEKLKAQPDPRIPDVAKLEEAVNNVKVNSAESLTLHGAEVDAINYPESSHIDVNRKHWQEYEPSKRTSLVLHEYLGILRVNDSHYEVSSSYADAFTKPEKKHSFEAAVTSQYGMGHIFNTDAKSKQPGVGAFVGVKLSEYSTLGINGNFQKYVRSYDDVGSREHQFTEVSLAYRHWLASSSATFRPYAQLGLGYASTKHSSVDHLTGFWTGIDAVNDSNSPESDATLQAGGGARYKISNEIGIDLSGHVHRIGTPWKSSEMLYFGQVGLDIAI